MAAQLCMAVMRSKGELNFQKFDYLLRGPKVMGVDNSLGDWVSDSVWGSVQVRIANMEGDVATLWPSVADDCCLYSGLHVAALPNSLCVVPSQILGKLDKPSNLRGNMFVPFLVPLTSTPPLTPFVHPPPTIAGPARTGRVR